jgi:hypothetical protein
MRIVAPEVRLSRADRYDHDRGLIMKAITVLAVGLGLCALGACNKNPNEQAADNIEANYENTADTMEANVDNAADAMQANTENAADAVRNVGEEQADQVRNSADADGNSAN